MTEQFIAKHIWSGFAAIIMNGEDAHCTSFINALSSLVTFACQIDAPGPKSLTTTTWCILVYICAEKSKVWSAVLISGARREKECWEALLANGRNKFCASSGGRGSHSDRPRWLGYGVSICMLIKRWWSMQGNATNKNAISVAVSPLVTLAPRGNQPKRHAHLIEKSLESQLESTRRHCCTFNTTLAPA